MRRLKKLATIRLLPVNSSDPVTTTKNSPSEKPTPMRRRAGPVPSSGLTAMVRANTPPRAMNAPAMMPRMEVWVKSNLALPIPARLIFRAISSGVKASDMFPLPRPWFRLNQTVLFRFPRGGVSN